MLVKKGEAFMKRNIFIGGAWPYANNTLHVGHLASLLPGDIIARFFRQNGDNVIYVSGTDCHGTPITVRAQKAGVAPKDIATEYDSEFRDLFNKLNFSYDNYSNTMRPYHLKRVQEMFKRIYQNGYLYPKKKLQDYCTIDNKFLADREIEGHCPYCGGFARGDQCEECLHTLSPSQLKDKVCKICGKSAIEQRENEQLVFKLSAFQKPLADWLKQKSEDWRTNAVNETRKYLKDGLKDRDATRDITWGVPVDIEGFKDKKVYVWFEAVLGYITAGEQVCQKDGLNFDDFVKGDNCKIYLVHGKDNIPFHTVIYPALLLSLEENYRLPDEIISSEYVNVNGEKMSKSKGNFVSVKELLEKYPVDLIRFYFSVKGPEKRDMNFIEQDLIHFNNKVLVGGLGNFINRNLSFLNKKCDGKVPQRLISDQLQRKVQDAYIEIGNLIKKGAVKEASEKLIEMVAFSNKYYDEHTPWILFKESQDKFYQVSFECIYLIINLANLLAPFMPETSNRIFEMLNFQPNGWKEQTMDGNVELGDVNLLFNRI